jgi:hypothetical protein
MACSSGQDNMSRDRAGYLTDITIRGLLERNIFVGAEAGAWRAIGEMTIDGRPLIDEPYRIRSDSDHETRLAGPSSEVILVARALYLDGQRGVALTKHESPDFDATLRDGRQISIEVTEVVDEDQNRRGHVVTDMDIELKNRVSADPTLAPEHTYVAFNLSPIEPKLPAPADRRALVDEMIEMLRTKSWSTYEATQGRRPANPASLLDRYGVWLHLGELPNHPRGHVALYGGGLSTIPRRTLTDVADERLQSKIGTARKPHFRREHPLWLVLAITDPFSMFRQPFREFATKTTPSMIEPYERVFLNDGTTQVVIDAAQSSQN